MGIEIPTTKQITDRNVANFEQRLNQTVPQVSKAFYRVLSAIEALGYTELYKFGVERALQNLALTATGEDLDRIGSEYGINRKPAEPWEGQGTTQGIGGTIIPAGTQYVSNFNQAIYFTIASAEVVGSTAVFDLRSQASGNDFNLADGTELTISQPIANLDDICEILETTNFGADRESDEDYRRRVLNEIRTVGGGGNAADYRRWAEEVGGVRRAFPYSGKPLTIYEITDSLPGDRTVYVESQDRSPASSALLDEVRDHINRDPVTGFARPPLGEIDDNLWIESVVFVPIYVEVRGLSVDPDVENQVKLDIRSALTEYFAALSMYVEGIDFAADRNDQITDLTVSTIVQDVIGAAGGTASGIAFGVAPDTYLPFYQLNQGELATLGGSVTYV